MDDELHLGFDYGAANVDPRVDDDLLDLSRFKVQKPEAGAPQEKAVPQVHTSVAQQQTLSDHVETLSLISPNGPAPVKDQFDFAPPEIGAPDVNFDVPEFVPLE